MKQLFDGLRQKLAQFGLYSGCSGFRLYGEISRLPDAACKDESPKLQKVYRTRYTDIRMFVKRSFVGLGGCTLREIQCRARVQSQFQWDQGQPETSAESSDLSTWQPHCIASRPSRSPATNSHDIRRSGPLSLVVRIWVVRGFVLLGTKAESDSSKWLFTAISAVSEATTKRLVPARKCKVCSSCRRARAAKLQKSQAQTCR